MTPRRAAPRPPRAAAPRARAGSPRCSARARRPPSRRAAAAAPGRPARGAPRPRAAAAAPRRRAEPTTASAHRHGPTLDDLVAGAWEGLLAGAPADCLVCGAPMAPRHSAGAGIVGGRCGGCGTTVS